MSPPQSTPQAETQSVGDAQLQYLHYAGPGPTIILQHATGFLPWMWDPIARRLAEHHNVIAPYFCDHRPSDIETGGLSWIKLAEDLFRLCAQLGIQDPFMVGNSMGATVITLAEAIHGPFAAGMILFEPIFFPKDYYDANSRLEDHPLAVKAMRRRSSWRDLDDAKAYLKTKELFRNWDDEMLDLYLMHGMVEDDTEGGLELACPPEEEAALFLGGKLYDPWPMMARIPCPVLVIEGRDSGTRKFVDFAKASQTLPNGSYRLVDDVGHLIPMEKPEESLEIILEFISSRVVPS